MSNRSTVERELLRKLFPSRRLDVEALNKDVLQPIDAVSENIQEIRDTVTQRVADIALVLTLSDVAEIQATNAKDMQGVLDDFISLLQEQDASGGVLGRLDAMSSQLESISSSLQTFIEGANAELKASVLTKLSAYLDRV